MENNKQWWESSEVTEGSTNDFYEVKVGDQKLRILTKFERVLILYKGVFPNSKYVGQVDDSYKPAPDESVTLQGWAWGIVRETGEMKILQFGKSILQKITTLKNNPEYKFEGFPMLYDITLSNTGDGPNRYSITPARQNTDITSEEMEKLNKVKPIAEIITKIRNKQDEKANPSKPVEYPKSDGQPTF